MPRLFLAVVLLAFSCDAFVVTPSAGVATRTAVPANTAPMMLFGGGAKPAKTGKKVAKKAVKKVAKKVNKTPVKKVAKRAKGAGFNGPAAAQPGSNPVELVGSFFSAENWGVQAVSLLNPGEGVPAGPLIGVGVWILLVLRFTIFYGFFGSE